MTFKSRIHLALQNEDLHLALDGNYTRSLQSRDTAIGQLANSDEVRDRARAIRQNTLAQLDKYLDQLETQVTGRGGVVHWAENSSQAADTVLQIAKTESSELIAKSKSMVTEEIQLNNILRNAGLKVVETDLGEFILQLRGDKPSHIVAPAIHLTRTDIAKLFESHFGLPQGTNSETFQSDVPLLVETARIALRKVFLEADIGVSGVNFAVAESGVICLVTNEGNGRLVTTAPRVHIAVMGIERVVPTMADLEIMLRVLARSATGQKITCYTALMSGPRRIDEPDGPDQLHLILVDNGRTNLLGSEMSESLLCIRCGACLNICPVYREIGGHAYDSVYPGPIGSIISPGLGDTGKHGDLAQASSMCGACKDVCPVRIDIPTMLIETRKRHNAQNTKMPGWNTIMKIWSWAMRSVPAYTFGIQLARLYMRLSPRWAQPTLLLGLNDQKHVPGYARPTFRKLWHQRKGASR